MSSSSKKGVKRKLDVAASSKSLWLVKIPASVAETWRTAQSGEKLGSLSIESIPPVGPRGKPRSKVNIQLRSDIATANGSGEEESEETAVTEFTLDEIQSMKGGSSNMLVFDPKEGQGEFDLKGHISTLWSLTPKDNEKYRQAVKSRQLNASTKIHSVKAVDSKTVFEHSNKVQEVGFKPPAYVTDKKRELDGASGVGLRRVRGEKATEKELKDLKRKLLEVFGEREYLTFKEINAYCQAYENDLRDLVRKYCDYHTKGTLKTYYELKAEYKGNVTSSKSS